MACYHKQLAFQNILQKQPLKFTGQPYYANPDGKYPDFKYTREAGWVPIAIPCGSCRGCRIDKSKSDAVRCMNEASLHKRNCFITLTYSNENLPAGGTLVKQHVVDFMKRLRKHAKSVKIRSYGCGEYGEKKDRPHYHILLFNWDFTDKVQYGTSRAKWDKSMSNPLYTSKKLEKLWGHGYVQTGTLTMNSAGYVARYVNKKLKGDKAKEVYGDKLPECSIARSLKPGIGADYYKKFKSEMYVTDSIVIKGKEFKIPRYYDILMERENPEFMKEKKDERSKKALASGSDNTYSRLKVRETFHKLKIKQLIRNYEKDET